MAKREKLSAHIDLIAQWDFEKNELDPEQLTMGSGRRAWWKCTEGHSWESIIANRRYGAGCPHCSGNKAHKREKLTDRPDLMEQWDYARNELDSEQLTVSSSKKAWWKCAEGHSWEAVIANRSRGTGCPYCSYNEKSVREKITDRVDLITQWDFAKNELDPSQLSVGSDKRAWWKCDKGHSWDNKISKQQDAGCPYCSNHRILPGFNDLQTKNPGIAVEWAYEKNKLLPSQVMPGSEIKVWWKCSKGHLWQALVMNRNSGGGCPYCAGKITLAGFNDLQTRNPALAAEWVYEKNKLMPSQVTPGSNKKVWWKCDKGHLWQAFVCSRTHGQGCPYCVGKKVLAGFNDLQTINPALAAEWGHEKNDLMPSQVTAGSTKRVWWKCNKGHEWKSAVAPRNAGNKCPYCGMRKVLFGFNDLESLSPQLLDEWDYEKNKLPPSHFLQTSAKEVWWRCKKGHSWKTKIYTRSINGCSCPRCYGRITYVPRCTC